jgi:SAM-dependent methyltransferase
VQQCWPAPERNKEPILAVLRRVLPPAGRLLELASGSGQHAVHFARHIPAWTWQPSEIDEDGLASIRAWVREAALPNLREPLRLDVAAEDWGVGEVDAVFSANLLHISPWSAGVALLRGAGRHLTAGGVLVLYGPFRLGGAHTASSNEAFDADLRARDARWGVRDLADVEAEAARVGLTLAERVEMPANNQTLVFAKSPFE